MAAAASTTSTGKKTILIVDNKEENRYLLEKLIAEQGHHVISAVHGAEALEKARRHPPDLVISDILMPVMDGFSLCRQWKKEGRLKSVPFIFYTATYTDERDRRFALGIGADRFIVKPIDPDEFSKIIQELLQTPPSPLTGPAQQEDPLSPPAAGAEPEESAFLKQYNEVLIRKLEAKMEQLEQANQKLVREITAEKRKVAESEKFKEELERLVAERTAELQKKIAELEELNRAVIGRELKMMELKKRIEELEKQKR